MKLLLMTSIGLAVVASFALPAAAQGGIDPTEQANRFPKVPTPTTLYFHINGFQDFPINTQKPDDSFAQSESFGQLTHTVSCIGSTGAGSASPLLNQEFHTFYGYISPSYVQYDKIENGKPRIHQERGISYDVELGGNFELKWYLQTQVISGNPGAADPNTAPVVIPNVKIQATMRAGDAISVGNEAYDEGALIAQGLAGPFTLAADGTGQVPAPSPPTGSVVYHPAQRVYEFTVPMELSSPVIPRADGGNLRIDVFIDNPGCTDPYKGMLMPNAIRVHSSPDYRPRMELVVNNPIMIPYLHPQFVAGDLIVHTQLNSPWGNYDVDESPGGIEVTIDGPTPAKTIQRASFVQHALDHNKHQDAVDVTYLWDFEAEQAQDGLYTVTVKVRNDQGTAEAVGTSKFAIGKTDKLPACKENIPIAQQVNCVPTSPQAKKESPGAGILIAGVLVACALVARRRLQ